MTERAVPKFSFGFAETTLQLKKQIEIDKVRKVIQLVFDWTFDAEMLLWHVKKLEDCKRLLEDNWDSTRAAEGFAKRIVKTESDYLVSRVFL